jgi:hypothetical protein
MYNSRDYRARQMRSPDKKVEKSERMPMVDDEGEGAEREVTYLPFSHTFHTRSREIHFPEDTIGAGQVSVLVRVIGVITQDECIFMKRY